MRTSIATICILSLAGHARADWAFDGESWVYKPDNKAVGKPDCICGGACNCAPGACPSRCPVSSVGADGIDSTGAWVYQTHYERQCTYDAFGNVASCRQVPISGYVWVPANGGAVAAPTAPATADMPRGPARGLFSRIRDRIKNRPHLFGR